MTVLQTHRMTLRPCHPEDCTNFVALEQDPEVMRFLNGGKPVDRDRYGPDTPFLMPDGTEPHIWTACRLTDGQFIGWFCLWPEDGRQAELGYRLRRADWGQGLASEGATALLGWGFRTARYDRVFATTMAVNSGSRRVMEKAGLRCVRTIHEIWSDAIPGSEQGEVEYALTRAAWQAGRDA